MKVGITLSGQHPMSNTELVLGLAEQLKMDSVWVPDHLMGVFHPGLWSEMAYSSRAADPDAFYDPWIVAGVVGRNTEIPFGIAVTDANRRRAADVVRSALTLQHVCPGGFNLGVGSGEAQSLVTFGYPFEKPVAGCEEFLIQLRSLLDTGHVPEPELSGRTGIPRESSVGPVRVWVAGHGPRMLRLTGQYGDGWLPAWPMSPEDYGDKKRRVAKHAVDAGRPEPESGLLVIMLLGESRDYISDLMEKDPLGKLLALFSPADRWAAHGFEHPFGPRSQGFVDGVVHDLDPNELRRLAPTIPMELVEETVFLGSADDIVERIGAYSPHGLAHVVLGNVTGVVGGFEEVQANAPGLGRVREALRSL